MKKRFGTILFFIIIIAAFLFVINNRFRSSGDPEDIIEENQQGIITIINIDGEEQWPIKNTEFIITAVESGEIIESLVTDEDGLASSKPLDYGTSYRIEQVQISEAYGLSNEIIDIEIGEENHVLVIENNINEYVKDIYRTETNDIIITEVDIPVEVLMQKPELPNGCEITSLTAVLNFYGYGISKTEMSEGYLPMEPFYRKNDRLYGANPYEAFAGDPSHASGFFVYAPPIVEAANQYIHDVGGFKRAINISGSTRDEIIQQLDKGRPVVIWVTLDLSPPRLNYSWYFSNSEEEFIAPVNLHAVVLRGYDESNVYIMNPLKGQVIHNADVFFDSYFALGGHAVVLVED
ncbi:C39 family peptidase [Natronincola ferrireducens]|uniref:Uncharacterized protein YvpB n=1 Tax=Natronincola ferrireducens TaxID=393762 RepID=A0A1G9DSF3_9FIRM|nr:C39 family peptidase [Natronincola ferrireducens]SDK66837.1 Uncharacterized protein YvpB [Natronincola ferrireducens]